MKKTYETERIQAVVRLEEYLPRCVDIPTFFAYCRACRNYGARWSCPPFSFDPMEVWNRFDTLVLYGTVFSFSDRTLRERDALQILSLEKERMLSELYELEREHPGSLALSAGTCTVCGEQSCEKMGGLPCKHPDKMRYSIEALGGDVAQTAEVYLKRPLLWIRDGVLPAYLMLVGGLLRSGAAAREDGTPT